MLTISERREALEFLRTQTVARELDAVEEELEWQHQHGTPGSVRLCANTVYDLRTQMYQIMKQWAQENLEQI